MKDGTFTADRLLALYDRVAEAEDAIPRLRRFVLDLAVRGKLVEQDPSDEPAAELLKRIKTDRAKKVASGESRKKKDIDDTVPAPFSIPDNWIWCRIGEVADLVRGISFPASEKFDVAGEDRIACFRSGNIQTETVWSDFIYVPRRIIKESSQLVRKGDILISIANSYALVGKCSIINEVVHDATFGAFLAAIRFDELLPDYGSSFLASDFSLAAFRAGSAQTTNIANITFSTIRDHALPLPPLAEQHRIVAKVDELIALCDRLEGARAGREAVRDRLTAATLAHLTAPETDAETFPTHIRFALQTLPTLTTRPDQIKTLRQTILNLAVRGKLVAQDPTDEPAAELLARFKAAKIAHKQATGDARNKLASDAEASSYPLELPEGWAVQSFENLFLFIDYRGNTPPKTDSGVPLITAKNVRMGSLNREPREFISEITFKSWMTRGFPKLGDLFFTTEAPLANVCLNDIEEPFALAQRVICLQPYSEICTRYLMLALCGDVMQSLIDGQATGMTAKGIKAAKLKPLPIPLPPLAEQHRIVAKVDALMALCDQLEASLTTATTTRTRLLAATLRAELAGDQEVA